MLRIVWSFSLVLVSAGGLVAESLPARLRSLVEAEIAFAQASEKDGTRSAFLTNLATDAVLFRPRPVAGRDWTEASPPSRGRLSWQPSFADVSAAGDMGYTTGPYVFTSETGHASHGHFVTVWKKTAEGEWKVAIDHGTSHEAPASVLEEIGFPTEPVEDRGDFELSAERDRLFARDRAEPMGSTSALGRLPLRVYRDGRLPILDSDQAQPVIERERGVSRKPMGGSVSSSGDLGFTYGLASDDAREYAYFRIWRFRGEYWILALDLLTALPSE